MWYFAQVGYTESSSGMNFPSNRVLLFTNKIFVFVTAVVTLGKMNLGRIYEIILSHMLKTSHKGHFVVGQLLS